MLTGFYQSTAIILVALSFYMTDAWFHQKYDRVRADGRTGRSWPIILTSMALAALLLLQPVFLPQLGWSTAAPWGLWLQISGAVVCFGGLLLNVWARRHLGQFYVQRSEVQSNHRLIDSGPYAYVRHPLFTAYFMLVIGWLFINPSTLMLTLNIGVYFYLTNLARKDEAVLRQHLPEYQAYMARTPRFFPRPASRRATT